MRSTFVFCTHEIKQRDLALEIHYHARVQGYSPGRRTHIWLLNKPQNNLWNHIYIPTTGNHRILPVKSLLKREIKIKPLQTRDSTGVLFGPSLSAVLKSFLNRSPTTETHKHYICFRQKSLTTRGQSLLSSLMSSCALSHVTTRGARADLNTAPDPPDCTGYTQAFVIWVNTML